MPVASCSPRCHAERAPTPRRAPACAPGYLGHRPQRHAHRRRETGGEILPVACLQERRHQDPRRHLRGRAPADLDVCSRRLPAVVQRAAGPARIGAMELLDVGQSMTTIPVSSGIRAAPGPSTWPPGGTRSRSGPGGHAPAAGDRRPAPAKSMRAGSGPFREAWRGGWGCARRMRRPARTRLHCARVTVAMPATLVSIGPSAYPAMHSAASRCPDAGGACPTAQAVTQAATTPGSPGAWRPGASRLVERESKTSPLRRCRLRATPLRRPPARAGPTTQNH